MSNLPLIHWLNDTVACWLGFLLNMFLILAIFKTSQAKLQAYANLVLVGAVFDVIFSIFEWLSLHQLLIKDGIMFVMPHGLEKYLFPYIGSFFMVAHCFVGLHGLFILAAQYHYRYCIIARPDASVGILLRNCAMTASAAMAMAVAGYVGTVQAMSRGYDYYLAQVDAEWFDGRNHTAFLYAMDFRDSGTLAFFFVSFGITTVCFGISIYYAYRAWEFVSRRAQDISKRTAKLQSQFTKSLVAQTVNAVIFSVVPVSVMCLSMQFRLSYRYAGLWVMSTISWLAAANALLTLVIIKAYRGYALRFLCLHRVGLKRVRSTTATTSEASRTRVAPVSQARASAHSAAP